MTTKYPTVKSLREQLKNRRLTCKDLTTSIYERIKQEDGTINAFVTVCEDLALSQAEKIDHELDKGNPCGPLAGIPIALKDNLNVTNYPTTCASKILEGYISPYDATVVKHVMENGLIPIGKVNMDEFAMGSSNEYSAHQPTKNPWNTQHVPGGSSGGSAASVAAGFVPLSLGSDTGGSIRQPAAFCGIVGLKPTYGRVSRYGLVAFASSLDQIGPFAHTVEDCAELLGVISGHDPLDSTSENKPTEDFLANLDKDIKGIKIGVPKELMNREWDADINEKFEASLDQYRSLGATIETISLGDFDDALSSYYIIAPAEASANLARFDGVRYGHRADNTENLRQMYNKTRGEGFGAEVKRRILLGTFVLSSGYYDAYYLKAQKVRTLVKDQFNNAFQSVDIIATPTAPSTAFKLGEMTEDPVAMYLSDIATIPVNLAGLPGISVPCGFSTEGLPIGLQLIGKAFDETQLLQVAHQYQIATDFHTKTPSGGLS